MAIEILAIGGAALLPTLDSGPASPLRHVLVVPVVAAALRFGVLGGILGAIGAVLLQAPALFAHLERGGVVAATIEDGITWLMLLTLGPLVGALASEARRQRERYGTLLAVQRELTADAPLDVVLGRLRACLRARLDAAEVALAVREGDRIEGGQVGAATTEQALAAVLERGEPVFQPDAGGGSRPRRVAAVPLLAGVEVVGALAVERIGELGRRERRALATLGVHLGLALENARLLSRQRRFAEELADKVAAATRHLEDMDRAKSTFVAITSHELRTPLTALMGFAELLTLRRFSPEEVRRLSDIIRREAQRLGRIVDDLLDLSRLERGQPLRLTRAAIAVEPALMAAAEVFGSSAPTHEVAVCCDGELPSIDADGDALDRILKNLLTNAAKYSPVGSRVALRARALDGERAVEFAVEDEGRGIAPEALPRVFDPYYRAPGASSAAPGLGLGLGVVKALVEAHGGAIRVASVLGVGTRVTFTLPAVP